MSNARHAASRRHALAPVPAPTARGRHRATPARQVGRGSVVAGAAALSLAAAGGLASASTGVPMAEPAVEPSVDTGAFATLAPPVTDAASRSAQRAPLAAL